MHPKWAGALAAIVAGCIVAAIAGVPAHAATAPGWHLIRVVRSTFQELTVTATGPDNAWAVGDSLVIARWTGHVWELTDQPPHLGTLNLNLDSAPVGSSSAANAWIFPAVYEGTTPRTVALHWHHSRWTTYRLPRNSLIGATAVTSANNVWAFGTISHGRTLSAYNLRYDGHGWRRVSLPVAAYDVSVVTASNIWAVGPSTGTLNAPANKQVTLAMHWNGHHWSTLRIPVPAVPRGGVHDGHIAAAGAGNLWYGYINFTRNYNFISNGLLHWSDGRWHRLKLPHGFTYFLNSAAQDGTGGLWICSPDALYHYSHGRWAEQITPNRYGLDALTWIPGSKSAWAVGVGAHGHGIILRYIR